MSAHLTRCAPPPAFLLTVRSFIIKGAVLAASGLLDVLLYYYYYVVCELVNPFETGNVNGMRKMDFG